MRWQDIIILLLLIPVGWYLHEWIYNFNRTRQKLSEALERVFYKLRDRMRQRRKKRAKIGNGSNGNKRVK